MKWIFRAIVLAIVVYGAQIAYGHFKYTQARDQAREQVASRLDAIPAAQRRATALMVYLSFHWANATLLPALCQEQGVDISSYTQTYTKSENDDYEGAGKAYRSIGGSERSLVAGMNADPSSRESFKKIFTRGAGLSDGDMTDTCRAISKKPDVVAGKMRFRELFPYAWELADVH